MSALFVTAQSTTKTRSLYVAGIEEKVIVEAELPSVVVAKAM
jgi:hypothetical protein